MYSIVIPTMWKSDIFNKAIMSYRKSKKISEIIIINNDIKKKIPIFFNHPKIKILNQNKNIFVNPSWNLGVKVAKNNNIIIANDDVFIHDLGRILTVVEKKGYDLVGLNLHKTNKSKFIEIDDMSNKKRPHGFGMFFIVKKDKYVNIPDDIKIWYGDDIQFYSTPKKAIFSAPKAELEVSKTVKSNPRNKKIITEQDRPGYKKFVSENKLKIK